MNSGSRLDGIQQLRRFNPLQGVSGEFSQPYSQILQLLHIPLALGFAGWSVLVVRIRIRIGFVG